MNIPKSLSNKIVLSAIVIAALFLRFWHINWGLPDVYEETFPFSIAWKMWNWGKTGLDLNPHFFNYPSLTIYLNFVVQGIHYGVGHLFGSYPDLQSFQQSYHANPTVHILLARVLSVGFDMGTVFMLWKFGTSIGGSRLGLLAGGLGAINPMLVQQAHLVSVDTPLAFFSIAALYFIYLISQERRPVYYYMSGLCIGLAAASKYTGAMILIILFLVHVFDGSKEWRILAKHCFDSIVLRASLIAGGIFLVCNPYIVLSTNEFLRDFLYEEYHMSTGHLGVDPTVSTGVFYLLHVFPNAFGLLLYACFIGTIIWFVTTRKRENILLVLFPIIYMAIISTWEMRADRYVLPVVPILILLGAMGALKLVELALQAEVERQYKYVFVALALLLAVAEPSIADIRYHESVALPDTRTVAKSWVSTNMPKGSAIAMTSMRMSLKDSTYQILDIPFYPVLPEWVISYYDTRWYDDFDFVIGSDYDLGRFQQDTMRYASFIRFYRDLKNKWTLAYEVKPEGEQSGPTIWLYRPPDSVKRPYYTPDLFRTFFKRADSVKSREFLETLANVLISKRQMDKAEQAVKSLAVFGRYNVGSLSMLMKVLKEKGRLNEALDVADATLQVQPKNAELLGLMGSVYFSLERYDDAETYFKRALECDPHYENAYMNLYIIYAGRKDKENAIDILSRYFAILPPGSDSAKVIQSYIEEIKTFN
jgi:4-amino-4-deoxy-L-arabinose transferase-like glycosyltransferase